ncbi:MULTISPECIES: YueH family protein [Bacillaceae]|uniref:YueH family protein n=1 Tax=Bacillaceae TaxID=186817 RepID=UPI001BDEB038|nr:MULTISPECIES: YueH family protein [Bacillaceae]MDX8366845.1 YueH family protein [Cytobacillus sp. IB215665]
MKIRKAIINNQQEKIYLYENKKEEYTIIAIPIIEWSFKVDYEQDAETLKSILYSSLKSHTNADTSQDLTNKISQWVREM